MKNAELEWGGNLRDALVGLLWVSAFVVGAWAGSLLYGILNA